MWLLEVEFWAHFLWPLMGRVCYLWRQLTGGKGIGCINRTPHVSNSVCISFFLNCAVTRRLQYEIKPDPTMLLREIFNGANFHSWLALGRNFNFCVHATTSLTLTTIFCNDYGIFRWLLLQGIGMPTMKWWQSWSFCCASGQREDHNLLHSSICSLFLHQHLEKFRMKNFAIVKYSARGK